jgi:hypothetical protein
VLHDHCINVRWDEAISHLSAVEPRQAAEQIYHTGASMTGETAAHYAIAWEAPTPLVTAILSLSKHATPSKNIGTIFDKTDNPWLPLHRAAATLGVDPQIVKHLITIHPLALMTKDQINFTPLQLYGDKFSSSAPDAPVKVLLEACTRAVEGKDYDTLAKLVSGDADELRGLCADPDLLKAVERSGAELGTAALDGSGEDDVDYDLFADEDDEIKR